MNVENFILSKPEFDFFFSVERGIKVLKCGHIVQEAFDGYRTFQFDELGKIEFEVGFQSGWTAYPPGTTPPPPTKYLRKYEYGNACLKYITEIDHNSNQHLKSYEFNHSNKRVVEIIERDEIKSNYYPKRSCFNYDSNGNLIEEKIYIPSLGKGQTYITSEIIRNENNKIIRVINSNSAEHNGKLVSTHEVSTKECEYNEQKIIKTFRSPNSKNEFIVTAELLNNKSDLIQKIEYPLGFYKKIEIFEYDDKLNLSRREIQYKDKMVTEIYKYE